MQAANRLKEYRKLQKYTMQELYAISGVSTATIVSIEKYSKIPAPRTRRKLAEALKVDEAILFPEAD